MSDIVITPLMGLPNPVPGADPGPDYAYNIYSCLNILDGHNHSSGSGNQINPNGILINADLPFNSDYNATLLRSVRYVSQVSPLSQPTDLNCTYVSGVDLYYNDGSGNQVKITAGGSVNATSSGISSGTASAAFSGGVLIVNSNTNTPGNIQGGSILIGDNIVSSNFVTLSAPVSLAGSYTLTLPTALPAANASLNLTSSSGAQSYLVPGTNGYPLISSGSSVSYAQLSTLGLAAASVATANIQDGAVTAAKLAAYNTLNVNWSQTTTTSTSFSSLGSGVFTASGSRPVQMTISAVSGGNGFFQISSTIDEAEGVIRFFGNASVLQSWTFSEILSVSGGSRLVKFPLSLTYTFFPTAGGATYSVSVAVGGAAAGTASVTISQGQMILLEL